MAVEDLLLQELQVRPFPHHIAGYPRWRRSRPIWPACNISWWAHHSNARNFVVANGCRCGTGWSSSALSKRVCVGVGYARRYELNLPDTTGVCRGWIKVLLDGIDK